MAAPEIAQLGIWSIARVAALAVLATEALFLWTRRKGSQQHAGQSRVFWALIPALMLAGLCVWCSSYVLDKAAPAPTNVVAALAR